MFSNDYINNYLSYHFDEDNISYNFDQIIKNEHLRNVICILINENNQTQNSISNQEYARIMMKGKISVTIHFNSIIKFLINTAFTDNKLVYLKSTILLIIESVQKLKNEERCICFVITELMSQFQSSITKDQVKQYFQSNYNSDIGYLCPCRFECDKANHEVNEICGYLTLDFIDIVIQSLHEKGIINYSNNIICSIPIFN